MDKCYHVDLFWAIAPSVRPTLTLLPEDEVRTCPTCSEPCTIAVLTVPILGTTVNVKSYGDNAAFSLWHLIKGKWEMVESG